MTKNVKDVKEKRARDWMLTASEKFWSAESLTKVFDSYKEGTVAVVGQLEEGDGGYRHYQLYCEFRHPQRFSSLKNKLQGVHLEPRRESRVKAINYCTKEKGRIKEYSYGEMAPIKEKKTKEETVKNYFNLIRDGYTASEVLVMEEDAWRYGSQLDRMERAVRADREAFYKKNMREVKSFYLSGESRVGKTYYLTKKMQEDGRSVYRVTNYEHPFDSYDGEDVLVLDEFRTSIDFNLMLNILDGYPLMLPARYGDKTAMFTEVWMVSNESFYTQYQEVNVMMPNSYIAFQRRFNGFYEMKERGKLTPVTPEGASPEALQRVKDAITEEDVNKVLMEDL